MEAEEEIAAIAAVVVGERVDVAGDEAGARPRREKRGTFYPFTKRSSKTIPGFATAVFLSGVQDMHKPCWGADCWRSDV